MIQELREDVLHAIVRYDQTNGLSGITLDNDQLETLRQWYRRYHHMSFDKQCDDCTRNTINRIISIYFKNNNESNNINGGVRHVGEPENQVHETDVRQPRKKGRPRKA